MTLEEAKRIVREGKISTPEEAEQYYNALKLILEDGKPFMFYHK